jgi:D-alanine-D-alanine ligase
MCQSKGFTKHLMRSAGISTPRYRLLLGPELRMRPGLRYPVIVKPAREDASLGVDDGSVVRRHRDALERAKKLFGEFRQPILVEEYIEGRELHVAILGNRRPRVLPILEYDFARLPEGKAHIMTHEAKWRPNKRRGPRQVCPAPLEPDVARRVQEAALAVYELTGCRDYARMDTRLAPDGHIYVIEANPNPDLSEGDAYLLCAAVGGLSFSDVIGRIVSFALQRRRRG